MSQREIKTEYVNVTVRLRAETVARLDTKAQTEDRSRSYVVQKLLEESMAKDTRHDARN